MIRLCYGYSREDMHKAFVTLSEWMSAQQLPDEAVLRMRVIAEELMSNLVRHNTPKVASDMAQVRLTLLPSELRFELTDSCVPFDPIANKDKGYGLMITNGAADGLTYEQRDGHNHTTVVVKWKA